MASYGATPAAIAVELQRRFGLRPREAFRQALGWTQDGVASRLNAGSSGSATFTGARISDYERWPFGGRRPTLRVLTALATMFGTSSHCLVDLDDLLAMPDGDRAVLRAGYSSGFRQTNQSTHATTRTITGLVCDIGSFLDETELVMAVTERTADFGAWAESSNVGPMTIGDIIASTRRIAVDYLSRPPVEVYGRAGLLSDRVFRLLQQGHQRPEEERQLYVWAGYNCALLAWMAGDLGHLTAADSHARTAWICAERVGDDTTLRAWVLSTMSKNYLWDQRFEEAAEVAARGILLEPEGTAAVMLACQEADAWAEIGAVERARNALNQAEAARQVATEDHVGGLLRCGVVRQHNYAGSVLLRTGDAAEAVKRADLALTEAAQIPDIAYGTTAQIRIWAAAAHIGARSIDGAVAALSPVLALPPERRLDTLVRRLRDVGHLMGSSPNLLSSPDARSLHSAIMEFCTTGLARQLPR